MDGTRVFEEQYLMLSSNLHTHTHTHIHNHMCGQACKHKRIYFANNTYQKKKQQKKKLFKCSNVHSGFFFCFETGFPVALDPVLELALIDYISWSRPYIQFLKYTVSPIMSVPLLHQYILPIGLLLQVTVYSWMILVIAFLIEC